MKSKTYPKYEILSKKTGNRYVLEFQSFSRALEPVNPRYRQELEKRISLLEKTKRRSAVFPLVAMLEEIVEATQEKITARFLIPGPANLLFTFNFDPIKQDINGKIGLRIGCVLRKSVPFSEKCS
ncbi:MAG: hypothetical protein KGH93_00095 [Patescibacteria group bacterium]|nr:hypothetical protein [Patescibacteria group bacterium]